MGHDLHISQVLVLLLPHLGVRVPRPRVRRELLRKVARGRRLARLLDVEQRERADLGGGALHGAAAGPAVRPNHERR